VAVAEHLPAAAAAAVAVVDETAAAVASEVAGGSDDVPDLDDVIYHAVPRPPEV
jgi:hypothetical protein